MRAGEPSDEQERVNTERKSQQRARSFNNTCRKSIIYLSRILCLSVCECVCVFVCVCVTVCCGTLCYSFSFNNQTDQRDETEGLEREGIRGGEIGNGQIEEGGCEETFLCLSLNREACRFTVPPAVALSNYISSGKL